MLNTYGNTNKTLRALADRACGLRYDSPEAGAIMDEEDWAHHWPVVDGEGLLTGDVVETEDCTEEYINVDDVAMVSRDDLTAKQRKTICDGYVNL